MPRVTISEPGKTPQPYRFKLERKVVKIGRSSESDIIIECGSASTNHCTMERVDGGYILRDNSSTNGIKQDGTLMEIIDLYDGMEVLIGDIPMKFQLSESEIGTLAGEEFSTHQKKKLPTEKHGNGERRGSTASPRASHSHRPAPRVQKSPATVSFFLVFVLMIVGIVTGMSLRHFRDTGDFLVTKWIHGGGNKAQEQPAKPADGEDEGDGEDGSEDGK